MKKEISLSEEDIAILLDLLGKVQTRGQNLIGHPGELKTIWAVEAELENASDLRFEKDYRTKIEAALAEKWNANLVKLDFRRILNKESLVSSLGEQIGFPEGLALEWGSFDNGLREFCKRDQVIMLLNKEKMNPNLGPEIQALKRSIEAFNGSSESKIEILD
jgi:hypothetical protein